MIRKIDRCDVPGCVKVIRESFRTVADEFGFTEENAPQFTAFAVTEERLNYQLQDENRLMYGWYEGDQVAGYYSLLLQENRECELNNLCVLPEYRHHGIGKELLRHAFQTAESAHCQRMNIGIVEENRVLRTWYESCGFAHTGTKKFEFFPFTCGYMVKQLQTPETHCSAE